MQILRGRILAQRFFDIAEEIDLPHATALVKELYRRPGFVSSTRHIHLPNPPIEMSLPPRSIGLPATSPSDVNVRIYHVGALVVTFDIDIPSPCSPEELITLAAHMWEYQEAITAAARPIAEEISSAIRRACEAGGASDVIEDYTIYNIQSVDQPMKAQEYLEHLDVARLLLGEKEPVADSERHHLLHASFSYRPDDLVIIDWNSALIIDPAGSKDVPELLELASVQLLELRAYDDIVGRALDRLYDDLNPKQGFAIQGSKYEAWARRTMQRYIELSEVADRIDNSLKLLGDSWHARIYRSALLEFAIPHWHKNLRDKLEVLRQINEMLVDQITSRKSLRVEIAIVALIVFEIGLAFFKMN